MHECIAARAGRGALRPLRARSCSSPTTRSARPSTARTPPSAGRTTSTAILRATDERHWLVWTSRPAPLRAGLRRAAPRARRRALPAARRGPGRRLRARRGGEDADPVPPRARREPPREQRELIREHGAAIVDHPHFTPERIRRFVAARRSPADDVGRASCASRPRRWRPPTPRSSPSTASCCWRCSTRRPGPVAERDLAAALRRHATSGLPKAPADLVDRARRPLPAGDRDEGRLGAPELARPRRSTRSPPTPTSGARFLSRCGVDGAALALSGAGGSGGRARSARCCASDADWDALGDGLLPPLRRARRGRGGRGCCTCSPRPATDAEVERAGRARARAPRLERQGGQRRRDRRVGRARRRARPASRTRPRWR